MKICIVTDTICDVNGVSRFISDILKLSLKYNENIFVITSTVKSNCEDLENIYNIKPYFRIKMPFYKELDLVLPSYKRIEEAIDKINPDIIHVSTPGIVGFYGRKIAAKRNIPIVGIYHTDFPKYVYKNTKFSFLRNISIKCMRNFYKDFSLVITRSREYIPIVKNHLNIDSSKIKYLKHGTNIDEFNPKYINQNIWNTYNIEKKHLKFLYVGRITPEKNIEFLLEIWKEIFKKYKFISLVLVGNGDIEKYQSICKNQNIFFLGHKEKEELSTIYASSDYFIFPSTTDTLGQVVLEALASKTPVIVSDIGGPKNILEDSKEDIGFILKHDDLQSWIEKIEEIINFDEKRQETISCNAREYMLNNSIDNSFDDYIKLHKSIYSNLLC